VQDYMAGAIDAYYRGKPQVQRDEAMRSCGLMAQTLMLAARAKGLDSCPMDGFDFDAVGKLINLPDNHVIAMMVAVGKRAAEPKPRIGKLPFDEVVVRDRFCRAAGLRQRWPGVLLAQASCGLVVGWCSVLVFAGFGKRAVSQLALGASRIPIGHHRVGHFAVRGRFDLYRQHCSNIQLGAVGVGCGFDIVGLSKSGKQQGSGNKGCAHGGESCSSSWVRPVRGQDHLIRRRLCLFSGARQS